MRLNFEVVRFFTIPCAGKKNYSRKFMKVAIKRELRQKTIGTPSQKQLDMHLIAEEITQNLNVGWG
jgi:hypothetical protein